MKSFLKAIAVVLLTGTTVYACKSAPEQSEIATGVTPLTSVSQIPDHAEHLTVVAFGVDSTMLLTVAEHFAGQVEFFATNGRDKTLLDQCDVTTTPTVRFHQPGTTSPQTLIGDVHADELIQIINLYQLAMSGTNEPVDPWADN